MTYTIKVKIDPDGKVWVAVATWKYTGSGARYEVASQGKTRRAAVVNVLQALELMEEKDE